MPESSNMATQRRMATPQVTAAPDFLRVLARHETVRASLILLLLVNVFFFPFIWGNDNILMSARHAASIVQIGAVGNAPLLKLARTPDPGAPAWALEPWTAIIGHIYLHEKTFPLWNPYSGYGTPLAGAIQPQAFHPLMILLSLDPTPTTFAIFFGMRLWIAGIFTYLFLRLFIPHKASLAGATAFMFTGYFMMFLNMFHLSVEIMLPAVCYAFERLHRRFDSRTIVWSALVVCVSILGGAPESTFLVLAFGYCYYLFRAITDLACTSTILRQVGRLAIVNALGFAVSAMLLLPFIEYMRIAFSTHSGNFTPGLASPLRLRELLGYLAPLIQGPPGGNMVFGGGNGISGYFGMTSSLFAGIAFVGWVADRHSGKKRSWGQLVPFFMASATIMIMKRHAFGLVQWIGFLPLFRMVVLYKYLEPVIGFCIAVLCGFGVSRVLDRQSGRKHVAIATAILLGCFLAGYKAYLPDAIVAPHDSSIFFEATTAALLVLLVLTVVLLLVLPEEVRSGETNQAGWMWRHSGTLLLACLAAELFLIFPYPLFYKYVEEPDKGTNPFSGAPYITWLQRKDATPFRIFARDSLLYPNWAGVFGLFDIRNLDAMLPGKSLPFVQAFLAPGAAPERGDLGDRFTGEGTYANFTEQRSRRLLQLSSVRYLITKTPLEANSLIPQFLERAKTAKTPGEVPLGQTSWTIAGVTKPVLFQHPPSSPKDVDVRIESGRTDFFFSLGMDPHGYGGSCGDGADFMVDIRGANGRVNRVFRQFIDPYQKPADRHWFDEKVDLSSYAGQQVEILLSTDPGPKGDNCMDWAGWGDLRLGKPSLSPAYDKEVQIYEYSPTLPRAALFYSADVMASDDEALKKLTDPAFNIFRRAVVASADLTADASRKITELDAAPEQDASAARIDRLESREVDIEAAPNRRALLVLNDTDFPGWHAYVDGKEAPILNTNYLFRGVLLEAGRHHVVFRYEPGSFHAGLVISFLALLGLVAAARYPDRLHLD